MVGRKASPLMPKRKKKPSAKPKNTKTTEKEPIEQPDEEIFDSSVPSAPKRRPKKKKKTVAKRGIKPSAPQAQLSTEDKRVMRRRRQRRRLVSRIAALTAVGAVAVAMWMNWNVSVLWRLRKMEESPDSRKSRFLRRAA